MLVDAFEQCPLKGNFNDCPILEASVDKAKADQCYAQGEVVAEVRVLKDIAM
jgi:hypothetical protein